jgi:hypothetical protein
LEKKASTIDTTVRYSSDKNPPPNRYNIESPFSKINKGKVFSFGICREAYKKVYLKEHPNRDNAVPGPGTYKVILDPGSNALKYSMRPMTSNPSILLTSVLKPCR